MGAFDDPSYQVLYELVLRIARFGFKNGPRSNLRAFNFSGRADSPSCCVVVVIYPPNLKCLLPMDCLDL